MSIPRADVVIVGAGIAGAGLAYELAEQASVILLEREDVPGLHATGRSAAFYAETYGGPGVQPLTTASRAALFTPPPFLSERPFVSPRGALHVASPENSGALDALEREFAASPVVMERIDGRTIARRASLLRHEWAGEALWEPDCRDIDVAALHAAYLRAAKRRGARLLTGAELISGQYNGTDWRLETHAGELRASLLVNAAGAWADETAGRCGIRGVGIRPLRRTLIVADIDKPVVPDWPLTVDAGGGLYFKPDAGRLWISPHDEVETVPGDAQPEELDIAVTVDRFERATTAKVVRIERSWAGLRSFAPDRLPVYGFEPDRPGFFWCAGQGGFGIQTAPAASALCAALIAGGETPVGVCPDSYAVRRFR